MRTGLGALLYGFRLRTGLSQQDLAARAGMSVRALRDLEQGRVARPRAQSVQRLVAALDLPATDRDLVLAAMSGETSGGALQVGVLGPLSVLRDGATVEIRSAMVRDLLGLLAIQPNQLVSRDEIVDVLWGEEPPRTCVRLVHGYVGQLRELLEPDRVRRDGAGVLRHLRGGYRLDLPAQSLDLVRFDELVGAGALADALDAWRGPVLADAGERLRAHPVVIAVGQRRIATVLAAADESLAAGDADAATAHLRAAAADEPLHEGVASRLVLALAAAGEQAAALQLYGTVRERLADELGIEPGPELADAHLRVLRGLPATTVDSQPVPAQLPPDVPAFTGRQEHMAELDALLRAASRTVTIASVTGTAGVGKTALAVHWAHRVADRFPDGQLYVNLRGYSSGPTMEPIDALARFLRALGVPAERVPTSADEAADLYRTLLAGRRVLIVLDNAASPDQVRPLLPGSPDCMVVVTSRDALSGLVAREGAHRLPVDVLAPAEAGSLLRRVLGDQRAAAEPDATADLARLCAYLPLALRIAAANVVAEPDGSVAEYVERLAAGNRLAALEVEGDAQAVVRAALKLSYATLGEPARRLFRLLGLIPGPHFTAAAAAALTGGTEVEAGQALARLAHAHLVDRRGRGRYRFHDLLRLYAAELAVAEDGEAACAAATARLHEYYLDGVEAAAGLLYPEKLRLPSGVEARADAGAAVAGGGLDHAGASAWLDAERRNLLAVIRTGTGPIVWRLADGLRGYFFLRLSAVDWLAASTAGLAAAQAAGDVPAQAASHLSLADLYWFRGDRDQAIARYGCALAHARASGWIECQAAALSNLGLLYRQAARWDEAIDHFTQALDLNRVAGRAAGEAAALSNLGIAYWELGRLADAADAYSGALDLYRRIGSRAGKATTIANLGEIHHLLGDMKQAREHLEQALILHRDVGDRGSEAETLRCLAALHRDTGAYSDARATADAALTLAQDTGHYRLEADTCTTLGTIHDRTGEPERAVACYERALALARDAGARHSEAQALIGLATATGLAPDAPDPAAGGVGGGAPGGTARGEAVRAALALTSEAGFRLLEGLALTAAAEAAGSVELATRALAVHEETRHRLGRAATHLLLARLTGAAAHAEEAAALFTELGSPDAAEARTLL